LWMTGGIGDRINPAHGETREDERRELQRRHERRYIFTLRLPAIIAVRGPVGVAMTALV